MKPFDRGCFAKVEGLNHFHVNHDCSLSGGVISLSWRALSNIGSTPIGCHAIPVAPEGPALGVLHRSLPKRKQSRLVSTRALNHLLPVVVKVFLVPTLLPNTCSATVVQCKYDETPTQPAVSDTPPHCSGGRHQGGNPY